MDGRSRSSAATAAATATSTTAAVTATATEASDGAHADDELLTGEAVALDLRPGSFVQRAAGAIIDLLAASLLVVGLLWLLSLVGLGFDDAAFGAASIGVVVLAAIVAPTAVETATRGRSLGRWALGLRIVRDDGGSIGFRQAFIRALTGFIEVFSTLGGLATIVALLNTRSKRLGDLLAGTYSQYERVPVVADPMFVLPPELAQWSTVADVARLPDRLSRRIAQFLRQAHGLLPAARMRVASELAREVAPYVSPLPDVHPESLLLAVTVMRRERESTALRLEADGMSRLESTLGTLPHAFPDR